MSKLPEGWAQVILEDIVEVNPPKFVDLNPNDMVTFVPMAAVSAVLGIITGGALRQLREVSKGFTQFTEGDIIFAKITPSMENGKSAIATDLEHGVGFGSTEFHVLRSSGAVLSEYLWHYIRQQSFRADARKVMSGTAGQQRVPADYLKKYTLPLPPLAEQKRIVAKLSNLITRTLRIPSILEHIPKLMDKYKACILDQAFSGKLTEDFRDHSIAHTKNSDSNCPKGWTIKLLGEVSDIQSGIQVGKKRDASLMLIEVPYLRVANVQRGCLNLSEVKMIAVTPAEKDRLLLQQGDILMNEGGDRDKLGRGWIWDGQIAECIHQNHVFRIRLKNKLFPSKYVSHYANEKGQQYFFDEGTQTTNLASVSKRKVAALPIPIPPVEEAIEILNRIEAAFTWIDRVGAELAAVTKLLPRLNAAILSKAFKGRLVPQDPNDEPIGMLLSRIHAERKAAPTLASKRKPTTKKEALPMARSMLEVLAEATVWLPAKEAFQRCGISDSAETDEVETLYAELRELDKTGRLEVQPVRDEKGRKLYDQLKLKVV